MFLHATWFNNVKIGSKKLIIILKSVHILGKCIYHNNLYPRYDISNGFCYIILYDYNLYVIKILRKV